MKLSLAMIVKNEESVLGHCLESVQGLVDEIVIVDTGSSDATVEIAEAHGARVFPFAWVNDFALARNYALDRCTGDWLLVLDADEAIDVLDHALIRKICEEGAAPAYRLILRNYFSGGDHATLDAPAQRNTSHYSEGKDFCYYADLWIVLRRLRTSWIRFSAMVLALPSATFVGSPSMASRYSSSQASSIRTWASCP